MLPSAAVSSSHISLLQRPFGPRFLLDEANAGGAPAGGGTGDGAAGAAGSAAPSGGASDPPGAAAAAAAPGGGQPGAAAAPSPYRPDGLPDHLFGGNDRETIDKLHKAVSGFRTQQGEAGAVPEKPEGYSFEPSDKLKPYVADFDKDPVYGAVRGIAHKIGMPDKMFKAFVPAILEHFVDGDLVAAPVDPKAMLRDLAPQSLANATDAEKETAGGKRVQDNIAWIDGAKANKAMPEAVADFFAASAAGDPRAHAAIEWLRGSASEPAPALGGGAGGSGMSESALETRLNDPRNVPGSPQYEPAFARETDDLYKKHYG